MINLYWQNKIAELIFVSYYNIVFYNRNNSSLILKIDEQNLKLHFLNLQYIMCKVYNIF